MRFSSKVNSSYYTNRFSEIIKLKKEYKGEPPLIDFGIGDMLERHRSFGILGSMHIVYIGQVVQTLGDCEIGLFVFHRLVHVEMRQ